MKVYLVYALDKWSEYDDEYFIYDVCISEESAKKSIEEGKTEFPEHEWWIEEWTPH